MSGSIESGTVYRWIGLEGQYVLGVPARDLTAADLLEVLDREGMTREDVETTGLYVKVEWVEVEPFCGAPLKDGERCREAVGEWGERCAVHGVADCDPPRAGVADCDPPGALGARR